MVGIVEKNQPYFKDINRDLYNAALEPNQEIAKNNIALFIRNGADIHSRFERGRQAIHAAIQTGHIEIISMLVNGGANIYAKLEDNSTPIDIAILLRRFDILEYFIENAGLSLDKFLFSALKETTQLAIVKYFIGEKKVDLNAKIYDYEGSKITLLHYAAINGQLPLLKYLIEDRHANINVRALLSHDAPLHYAIACSRWESAEYLLAKGADLNVENSNSLSPLDLAILGRNVNLSKLLIDKGAKFKVDGVYTKILGFDPDSNNIYGVPIRYSTKDYSESILYTVMEYAHLKRAVSRTRRHRETAAVSSNFLSHKIHSPENHVTPEITHIGGSQVENKNGTLTILILWLIF